MVTVAIVLLLIGYAVVLVLAALAGLLLMDPEDW